MSPVSALAEARTRPPQREALLREPSVDDRTGYLLAWAALALKNLLSPHRLRVDRAQPLASLVWLTPAQTGNWRALFGCLGRPGAPLLCTQATSTLQVLRLFNQLGVDQRQVLQLSHRVHHPAGPAALGTAGVRVLRAALQGAWRVGAGKAVVVLRSAVHDPHGSVIAAVEDEFIVRRLPPSDLALLPENPALIAELLRQARRRAQLHEDTPGAAVAALHLAPQLERDFAALSGQFSPLHRSRLGALVAGYARPFAQGAALRNLVVARLHEMGLPLARLSIHFAAPAYLGQTLRLVVNSGRYELTEAGGTLVAWGEC